MVEFLAYIVLFALACFMSCSILAGCVAKSKGRSFTFWFAIGLVFGILGLIAAAGMSDIRKAERDD